jgi:hypothetical protein
MPNFHTLHILQPLLNSSTGRVALGTGSCEEIEFQFFADESKMYHQVQKDRL